jgi:multidrug resistance efflux pump
MGFRRARGPGGGFILAAFLAIFSYLTPSGSFVIVARVVEVTPNVSGQIVEIPVQPNVPVRPGRCCSGSTVAFQLQAARAAQLSAKLARQSSAIAPCSRAP